jgi:hypothetical protein
MPMNRTEANYSNKHSYQYKEEFILPYKAVIAS